MMQFGSDQKVLVNMLAIQREGPRVFFVKKIGGAKTFFKEKGGGQ